jgi:hypothetical protein
MTKAAPGPDKVPISTFRTGEQDETPYKKEVTSLTVQATTQPTTAPDATSQDPPTQQTHWSQKSTPVQVKARTDIAPQTNDVAASQETVSKARLMA